MRSRVTYLISILAVALSTACNDDPLHEEGYGIPDDGTIKFGVSSDNFTRASKETRRDVYTNIVYSRQIISGKDPVWLVVEDMDHEKVTISKSNDTRGVPIGNDSFNKFIVTAKVNSSEVSSALIDEEIATKRSDVENVYYWRTEKDYYWPKEDVDFYGYSDNTPGFLSATTDKEFKDNLDLSYTGSDITFDYSFSPKGDSQDARNQYDFVLAYRNANKKNVLNGMASLHFRHPLAAVGVCMDEDVAGITIKNIQVEDVYRKGSCLFLSGETFKWYDVGDRVNFSQDIYNDGISFNIERDSEVISQKFLADPFMLIPMVASGGEGVSNTISEDAKIKISVHIDANAENGQAAYDAVESIPFSQFEDGVSPGRIYLLRITKSDPDYLPIEDEQGVAGNNVITLNWENVAPGKLKDPENVHQIGVHFVVYQSEYEVTSEGNVDKGEKIGPFTYSIRYSEGKNYPSYAELGNFIELSNDNLECPLLKDSNGEVIRDEAGNEMRAKLDMDKYNHFTVDIYTDYVNDKYHDYNYILTAKKKKTVEIWTEKKERNKRVAFYIPNTGLLDDDDLAAADWFRDNFYDAMFVTSNDLRYQRENYGQYDFDVLWFPCGVSVDGGGLGEDRMRAMTEYANSDWFHSIDYRRYLDEFAGNLSDWSRNALYCYNTLVDYDGDINGSRPVGKIPGVTHTYGVEPISGSDIEEIKRYYMSGGNLLLTTFSVSKIWEFGVITENCRRNPDNRDEYTPHYRLFNELKPASTWFVSAVMHNGIVPSSDEHGGFYYGKVDMNDHYLYDGLFKADPSIFPECYKDGRYDDNGNWIWEYDDRGCHEVYVGGTRGVPMYPLLSSDAKTCENNNVCWDFNGDNQRGKQMRFMEYDNNCKFLGTWGQEADDERFPGGVGVIVEFYPWSVDARFEGGNQDIPVEERRHGRCICIGLGAYEFNNGLFYNPSQQVLNKYQTNVHKMTKNAIDYLLVAPKDKRDVSSEEIRRLIKENNAKRLRRR